MTRNRLIEAADEGLAAQVSEIGREGVERFCAEQNDRARRLGMDRYYRPRDVLIGERMIVETEVLEGTRAQEARAEAEGRPIERFVPQPGELARLRRSVERMTRKGKGGA